MPTIIKNEVTGEEVEIKKHEARYGRMCRRIMGWANLVSSKYDRNKHRLVMLSLTYEEGEEWEPNQIRDLVKRYRERLGKKLIAYAWVGELQKRKAVHYHFVVVVKRGIDVPEPDSSGMWIKGSSNRVSARSVYYLVTYLGKEYQKDFENFPYRMRAFAVWICSDYFDRMDVWNLRMSALPKWLEEKMRSVGDWEGLYPVRKPGGYWWLKIPVGMRRGKPYKKIEWFTSEWYVYSF